jgi:hypothetical protein
MRLFKRLFGGRQRRTSERPPLPNVPKDDSETEILACVLVNLRMRDLYGPPIPADRDTSSIGPLVRREFKIIEAFRQTRGYSHQEVETAFWSPELLQQYCRLALNAKRVFLENLSDSEFRDHMAIGRRAQPADKEGDAIVHYLTSVAFSALGVSV